MNAPTVSTVEELEIEDLDVTTARQLDEGVWIAEVDVILHGSVSRRVIWTDDGRFVASLAEGDGLHGFGGYDYETYGFAHPDEGANVREDVCCHNTEEAAIACVLGWMRTGQWCSEGGFW